jgi:hypothetical protein
VGKRLFRNNVTRSGRSTVAVAALVAAALLTSINPASACRGVRGWSKGDDLAKLRPGEIVVQAKALETYPDENRFQYTIMGIPYGYIYYLEISEVSGAADPNDPGIANLRGARIYVRLNPTVCEAYFPANFTKDVTKTLVLKMGDTGLYQLVGGQE